jgi:hypothetical protein
MGFVYFCIPVVGGWHVMQWAISKAHNRIGESGERLPNQKIEGVGDLRGNGEKVGAGGWGGGVHLTVSDEGQQQRNKRMLRKFLRKQRKKLEEEQEAKNKNEKPEPARP